MLLKVENWPIKRADQSTVYTEDNCLVGNMLIHAVFTTTNIQFCTQLNYACVPHWSAQSAHTGLTWGQDLSGHLRWESYLSGGTHHPATHPPHNSSCKVNLLTLNFITHLYNHSIHIPTTQFMMQSQPVNIEVSNTPPQPFNPNTHHTMHGARSTCQHWISLQTSTTIQSIHPPHNSWCKVYLSTSNFITHLYSHSIHCIFFFSCFFLTSNSNGRLRGSGVGW